MKNNKIIFFVLILFLIFFRTISIADVFKFEASEIQILNKGKTIKSTNGGVAFTEDNVEIYADEFEYDKEQSSLIAEGDVKLIDKDNQLIINTSKIIYLKNQEKIFIDNRMNAVISEKYNIELKKIIYDRKKIEILADEKTIFDDSEGNKFSF